MAGIFGAGDGGSSGVDALTGGADESAASAGGGKSAVASSCEPLVLLATDGKLGEVQKALESGRSSVNEADSNGYTALMAAASYGQVAVVRFLLGVQGVQVDAVDEEGDSALHYCRDVECARLLSAAGADASHQNEEELTPLQAMLQELEELDLLADDAGDADKLERMVEYLKPLSPQPVADDAETTVAQDNSSPAAVEASGSAEAAVVVQEEEEDAAVEQ